MSFTFREILFISLNTIIVLVTHTKTKPHFSPPTSPLYHTCLPESSTNCKHYVLRLTASFSARSIISQPRPAKSKLVKSRFYPFPLLSPKSAPKLSKNQYFSRKVSTTPRNPLIRFQSKKSSRNPLKTPKFTNFSGLKTDNVFLIYFTLPIHTQKRASLSTDS